MSYFKLEQELSQVPFPYSITILNPASNDMFLLLEGPTHSLNMIDNSLKQYLLERHCNAEEVDQIRCIRASFLTPQRWFIDQSNPIIQHSENVMKSSRNVSKLSQE